MRGELGALQPEEIMGNHIAQDPEHGRGASYEFEVIGTEGSIRCWHQLGSETVGSGWAGVRLVRHGAEGMDSYLFEEGELEAASVSDRGGQTVFCLEELVRIIDLMKPQLMAELR
eukprot:COSAG06_NODE_1057_length_10905_cov_6.405793_10_plen_115_part_00